MTVLQVVDSFLRRLSNRVAKVPSRWAVVAYFFVLVLFAGLYTLFADQFYHSTVRYEPYLHVDADVILDGIKEALADDVRTRTGSTLVRQQIDVGGTTCNFEFDCKNLQISNLECKEGKIVFKLEVIGRHIDGPGAGCGATNVRLDGKLSHFGTKESLLPTFREQNGLAAEDSLYDYRMAEIENVEFLLLKPEVLFPNAPRFTSGRFCRIPKRLSEQIDDFERAVNGLPSHVSGNLWRMFYLSAVTITTLGYGDIVPLTGLGRFLITVEAISGMLLIGLFLNCLANEIKGDTDPPAPLQSAHISHVRRTPSDPS